MECVPPGAGVNLVAAARFRFRAVVEPGFAGYAGCAWGYLEDMAKAVWNGIVVAESENFETVEGNVYFPETSLKREYFRPSSTTSTCPWKGQARYYSLFGDGQENPDAAWYYPDPKPAARKIKNHVAFWRGVEVEK